MDNIYNAIVKLPKPIRRVCLVQVFAFMGWCVEYTNDNLPYSFHLVLGSRFYFIRSYFCYY
jgi:hypothetical protein